MDIANCISSTLFENSSTLYLHFCNENSVDTFVVWILLLIIVNYEPELLLIINNITPFNIA